MGRHKTSPMAHVDRRAKNNQRIADVCEIRDDAMRLGLQETTERWKPRHEVEWIEDVVFYRIHKSILEGAASMRSTVIDGVVVRWLIGRDMDEVLGIDMVSHEQWYRWSRAEWGDVLREKDTIGIVYSCKETMRVFGFTVYRLRKPSIEVLKVAVHPLLRRQGIGRAMSEKIRTKLTQQRRQHATAEVEERNLEGQLWLQACGWKCVTSVGPSHDRVLRFVVRPGGSFQGSSHGRVN